MAWSYGRWNADNFAKWVDEVISPNILSVSHTNFATPSYRRNKADVLAGFQKAYEESWRMEDLEYLDVTQSTDYETI